MTDNHVLSGKCVPWFAVRTGACASVGCWLFASIAFADPPSPDFYARRDYPFKSYSTAIADVNGDGLADLVGNLSGVIRVALNDGKGSFRSVPPQKTGAYNAYQLVVADLNGDGKADLVMTGSNEVSEVSGIYVSIGNGDATFDHATFYPNGSDSIYAGTSYLTVSDFTGDGIPDVASAAGSGVWLFRGKGDGTFAAGVLSVPVGEGARDVSASDFNGDGKQDLVVVPQAAPGDGFLVLMGNGDGTFTTPQHFLPQSSIAGLATGRLGVNGYPGIAVGEIEGDSGGVAVFFGDGAGGFAAPQIVPIYPIEGGLGIADLNGDNIGDIVSLSDHLAIVLGTPANAFGPPAAYPIAPDGAYSLALGSLQNQAGTDIVTQSTTMASVLLNNGTGRFQDGIGTPIGASPVCGVAGDFNRDGKPDIALNTLTGFVILLGTGKAIAPLEQLQSSAVSSPQCLNQTGDLNGDGILDLAILTPGGVITFLGNGDGTFNQTSTTTGPFEFSSSIVLADFNHDGVLDVATNDNSLSLGNGDGTFQTPAPFIPDPGEYGFNNITAGDINNDGWPDVVLTNNTYLNPDTYILLNNRNGGFSHAPVSFDLGATQAVLADLNLDGYLDLVMNNHAYLGDGTGNFVLSASLIDAVNPLALPSAIVTDLNGDGIPDIALEAGDAAVYLGLGDGTFEPAQYFGAGLETRSILFANLHGQKASAGVPDLVLPNLQGSLITLINRTK